MTSHAEPVGIVRIEALQFFVRDLERSRHFYTERLDFAEIATGGKELELRRRERCAAFQAGGVRMLCSQPEGEGGPAWRWLRKHPDGVGTVLFEVEDARRAFRLLEERGANPISDLEEVSGRDGTFRSFEITTPFGDTTFRFVERRDYRGLYPDMMVHPEPKGGRNAFRFGQIDHVTSNFQTMKPALLWMEEVLGLEEFWEVQFHTKDAAEARRAALQVQRGSGLRSVVMRDPRSGVKLANNEPWRPAFQSSQIALFHEDNRGDGVQHAALTVEDVLSAVRRMRGRGVEFMSTPETYYDALPERISESGIGKIDEDVSELRELEILVDGAGPRSYLLQVFLRDAAGLYHEHEAGPFFFEIIQRKGDQGFGAGNFRALFESIERAQQDEGRV